MATVDRPEADLQAGYRAAKHGAAVVDRSGTGKLRISGRDRLDFIQRMSTNQVLGLTSGHGRATILTTAIGRIVDRLVVLVDDEEVLGLTSPGQAGTVQGWLSRYIFFMDQVKIEDVTGSLGLLAVYGPDAARAIERVTGVDPTGLKLYDWQAVESRPGSRVLRIQPLSTPAAFALLGPVEALPDWQVELARAGAEPGSPELAEILRLEAGRPAYGREMSEEYIPLEANLWDDVSFQKGCYIGQEIIARMESRGRLAKQLMGVRLERLPEGSGSWPLAAAGKDAGTLTSAGTSPTLGPIGLGFVRTAIAADEVSVRTDSGDIAGRVVPLPFR